MCFQNVQKYVPLLFRTRFENSAEVQSFIENTDKTQCQNGEIVSIELPICVDTRFTIVCDWRRIA